MSQRSAQSRDRDSVVPDSRSARSKPTASAGSPRHSGRSPHAFEDLKGHSRAIKRVVAVLEQIQNTNVTVLIEGETGTGKEIAARALHRAGPRRDGPFIALNCAGLSETLIQSKLFGHRKGSFTGAHRDSSGAFKEADGGTILLDELGDLPMDTQGLLLRVLQNGEITPLGTARPTRVDVRLISTTNIDLRSEVEEGRFRRDLYFRLMVAHVIMPPLRERDGDVAHLTHYFLDRYCRIHNKCPSGFAAEAIEALERYDWPGNVRELEHEVERAVVLGDDGQQIPLELLSRRIRAFQFDEEPGYFIPSNIPYVDALERLQREMVSRAMATCNGVIACAAKILGIKRSRLSKLLIRMGWSDGAH